MKDNVMAALRSVEEHLPEELASECVGEAQALADGAREQLSDANSLDRIMAVHRELTENIEEVLSSEERRPSSAADTSQGGGA